MSKPHFRLRLGALLGILSLFSGCSGGPRWRHQERHPGGRVRPGQAEGGLSLTEATLEASRTRLRPITMTSFAFIW
jgi:hypothetical protein